MSDRAELILDLRSPGGDRLYLQAADMLELDAKDLANADEHIDRMNNRVALLGQRNAELEALVRGRGRGCIRIAAAKCNWIW